MKPRSTNRELYVSDISFDAQEEDVRKLFAICGTVSSLHMVTDPKSGLFKGSAFIRMATAAEASDAIVTLDGARLINRCIVVTAARPKQPVAAPSKTRAPAATPAKPGNRPRRQRK